MLLMQGQAERAVPVLSRGAFDRSASVRYAALNWICVMDAHFKNSEPLFLNLVEDNDMRVRAYASDAIRRINPDLYRVLKNKGKLVE
jgi:hypothetical protein